MLVVPRLRGAIEGFIKRHGHWPTRIYVDPDTHHRHFEAAFAGAYAGADRELLAWVSERVQILAQEGAEYRAEDEVGLKYDYGAEGFSEPYASSRDVLKVWRSLYSR